jgi:hypothetical protein
MARARADARGAEAPLTPAPPVRAALCGGNRGQEDLVEDRSDRARGGAGRLVALPARGADQLGSRPRGRRSSGAAGPDRRRHQGRARRRGPASAVSLPPTNRSRRHRGGRPSGSRSRCPSRAPRPPSQEIADDFFRDYDVTAENGNWAFKPQRGREDHPRPGGAQGAGDHQQPRRRVRRRRAPHPASGIEGDRILIQLPGVDDPERVKEIISTAFLEFKEVIGGTRRRIGQPPGRLWPGSRPTARS